MLTLDAILNGLTEKEMDLIVGSRIRAGGNPGHNPCGTSRSGKGSYSSKSCTSKNSSSRSTYNCGH